MTTETRDLDRACAEAMGWTHMIPGPDWIMPEVLHWLRPDGSFKGSLPSFSTDPSTQAEKLRWLHANWALCVIIGHYTEKVGACAASPVAQNLHAEGTTIDEALARLVVAVAKAKKEQKL